jgi:hypothetical protein
MQFLYLAALAAQPAQAVVDSEPTETGCDYIDRSGQPGTAPTPGLHVLADTRGDAPYAPAVPEGAAIRCGRSDIVPAANDWKVVAAGYPFYIVDAADGPEPRVAVLVISQGQMRFRFIRGRLTSEEEPRIQARLNAFQLHFQR